MRSSDLIEKLKLYRLDRGMTQTELAQKLGVTFQTVNRWFNRHMEPSQIQEHQIKKLLSQSNRKV